MGAMINNGKKRVSKFDKMTNEQKTAECIKFWAAPNDALFTQETLACVFNKSISWFQLKRCTGGGIPYHKEPRQRSILYKKSDAIEYFSPSTKQNTSS
jgi:hypothetical protein